MMDPFRALVRSRSTFALVLAVALVGTSFAGCSKSQTSASEEGAADAQNQFSNGSVEYRTREMVEEITIIVAASSGDPDQALEQVRRFLETNEEDLEENAQALAQKFLDLEGEERRTYAERFNEYMQEATRNWNEVIDDVRRVDEEVADQIETLMSRLIE